MSRSIPAWIRICVQTSVMALLGVTLDSSFGEEQLLYLATTTGKTVTTYQLNEESGELTQSSQLVLPGNGGAMAFSPDQKRIYAAMTAIEGAGTQKPNPAKNGGRMAAGVATLVRGSDGSLDLINTAALSSRAPYIRTNKQGNLLLAAHYGAGDVTVYRIIDGVFTGQLTDHKTTERTAHCIELDPSGAFVFVPHTAPNRVYQFRLDNKSGKLRPNIPPFVSGPEAGKNYHAPRHYAHHPLLKMAYTSNEFGGGISAYRFDPKQGTLRRVQTLATLPPEYEGNSAAADIRITPDGRFAYVSNRDTSKRDSANDTRDSIAAISLHPKTGDMKIVGHFPANHFPRSICIDVSGKFLFAAGQRSNSLIAYRIDSDSGRLTRLKTYATGPGPIWVMCAAKPSG